MAVRYAGDFFGIPLADTKEENSMLLKYYPELKKPGQRKAGEEVEGARSFGDRQAAAPFIGFKTFEAKKNQQVAAPVFSGFKTFEQTK